MSQGYFLIGCFHWVPTLECPLPTPLRCSAELCFTLRRKPPFITCSQGQRVWELVLPVWEQTRAVNCQKKFDRGRLWLTAFVFACLPVSLTSLILEKKCFLGYKALVFIWWQNSLLTAPSINTWPDSEGFGDGFNFPTKGLGLVAHMFSWAALDVVLNNERRADPGCPISSHSPSSFSKESLLKEALTQIAESCVWNKKSCNKHFRL